MFTHFDKSTNRGGCSIKNRHAILFNNIPHTPRIRSTGRAFIHYRCGTVGKRPINNVAVPRNPTDIRSTPVYIRILQVKNPFGGNVSIQIVSSSCMHNSFGFTGTTRSVENKQHILAVHLFGGTICAHTLLQIMPPMVTSWFHVSFLIGTSDN